MEHLLQLALAGSLLLLAASLAYAKRDALHPGCLQPALWASICLLYFATGHPYRALGLDTTLVVVCASLVFAMAGFAVAPAQWHFGGVARYETTPLRPLLFWLALLGLPAYLARAFAIADSVGVTESMFINLRLALTGEVDGALTYGALGYLVPASFTSTLVELACSRRRLFEPRGWVAFSVALCYAVLATGRTYVFFLFISIAFVAVLQRRVRPLQMLAIFIVAAGLAFVGMGMLLNKIGEDLPNANAMSAGESVALYLLSGLAAFDLTLHQPQALGLGAGVFRSVMALLSAVGVRVEVASTLQDYVFVPEATNVYTVFYPYARDFGVAGVAVFMVFLGWTHAYLYQSARLGNPRMLILYAISMYPLLLQFFDDQYFSLLSMWVNYAVLIVACFRRQRAQHVQRGQVKSIYAPMSGWTRGTKALRA